MDRNTATNTSRGTQASSRVFAANLAKGLAFTISLLDGNLDIEGRDPSLFAKELPVAESLHKFSFEKPARYSDHVREAMQEAGFNPDDQEDFETCLHNVGAGAFEYSKRATLEQSATDQLDKEVADKLGVTSSIWSDFMEGEFPLADSEDAQNLLIAASNIPDVRSAVQDAPVWTDDHFPHKPGNSIQYFNDFRENLTAMRRYVALHRQQSWSNAQTAPEVPNSSGDEGDVSAGGD